MASILPTPSEAAFTRTLRLSITGQCNLSCFFCKPLGQARDLFEPKTPVQPSDVTKLVRILGDLGVTKVVIGGGEPLLRKDAPNFVKAAFAHRNIQDVRMVTNGTYLKAYADQLRKNGLRKVDVNFVTLNFKKYHALTKRDDLFRVLDGIEKIEKLNYSEIRINVHLLTGINEDEIIDFARLTKEHRFHVRFMEYCPVTQTGDPLADLPKVPVLQAKRRIDNFQKLHPLQDFDCDSPMFHFTDGPGKISFLSHMEVEKEACVPTLLFNADGVLSNERLPNRPHPILGELRRDAKQDKLRKVIDKMMRLHGQFLSQVRGKRIITGRSISRDSSVAEARR